MEHTPEFWRGERYAKAFADRQGYFPRALRTVRMESLTLKKFLLIAALMLIPLVGLSQSNSPQNPVEIKAEPRHHPKFENEFVRIWDVTVPGGDATLWHAHRNDNVVVTLAPAKLHIETLGRDPVDAEWKYGEVRFSKATYVHRAMNAGTTAFHNFTIELLKPSHSQ